jgi:hypothetical protein
MKLVKTASGKQTIKMSRSEWKSIGKKAGWEPSEDFGAFHRSDSLSRELSDYGQLFINKGNRMIELSDKTDGEFADMLDHSQMNVHMKRVLSIIERTARELEDAMINLDKFQKTTWDNQEGEGTGEHVHDSGLLE